MKQVLNDLKTGKIIVAEVPCPINKPGHVLITCTRSLISSGTERMLIEFGNASWFNKIKLQPEKARMVINKVRTDGLMPTVQSVQAKLSQPMSLGYSNVGIVIDSGDTEFKIGDRVISNGPHAQVVRVPKNLVAKVPDNVTDDTASFTVICSIALQGIRLINPTIGETVVVPGLGLIGLMAIQILKANGCKVIGVDFDKHRCSLAKSFGIDVINLSQNVNPAKLVYKKTNDIGADAVLITASSNSNQIIKESANMCRKRGRIVLVGVVGLNLDRNDFYEKEISFQVSCSYGPGRYDDVYEKKGSDYPPAYVRWTENRNFQAILELMSSGMISTEKLISKNFKIEDASTAYSFLSNKNILGIMLEYSNEHSTQRQKRSLCNLDIMKKFNFGPATCIFVGSGNYASKILIPSFKKAGANLHTVISAGGVNSYSNAKKYGFLFSSTDYPESLKSDADTVVISTQHNLHFSQVIKALEAKKHIFIEKPLALNLNEIDSVEKAILTNKGRNLLMVGFNRRFAPQIKKLKTILEATTEPKTLIMTMNAGEISSNHWTQDLKIGGGRILGEACHYIDLMRHLVGYSIKNFSVNRLGETSSAHSTRDSAIITLEFIDGSMGTINYFSNGSQKYKKEYIQVFCGGSIFEIDNFQKFRTYSENNILKNSMFSQNKGQLACVDAFVSCIKGLSSSPIPINEILEVSRLSIEISKAFNEK